MNFLVVSLSFLSLSTSVFFILMLHFMKKSRTDELTGLANYRYLKLYLKFNANRKNIGLVILDIDNFKEFNAISIHKGDEVLKEFSVALKTFFAKKAKIFRYRSGDEFALLFNNKSKEEIIKEVCLSKIYFNDYTFKCLADMQNYRINFCFGVSKLQSDVINYESYFDLAELELANAKRLK